MRMQLHVPNGTIYKYKMKPIKNNNFIKPLGGLWTSTYNPLFGSDWVQYSMKTGGVLIPKTDYWESYLLIPRQKIKLFVINSYEDLEQLMNEYRVETKLKNPSFYKPRKDYTIDFEKMQMKWDGIRLTKQGVHNTKSTYPYNLDGWDVESTVWFHWVFKQLIPIKRKFIPERELKRMTL